MRERPISIPMNGAGKIRQGGVFLAAPVAKLLARATAKPPKTAHGGFFLLHHAVKRIHHDGVLAKMLGCFVSVSHFHPLTRQIIELRASGFILKPCHTISCVELALGGGQKADIFF